MNRLKMLREEKGLLQEDIGKLLNLSGRAVGNYENGKRDMSPDTIIKLADFFGVTTDYLLGKSDERSSENFTIDEEDVKLVADSGFRGLNDYNKKVALDIIKSLKAKQDIEDDTDTK